MKHVGIVTWLFCFMSPLTAQAESLGMRLGQAEATVGPCTEYWGSNPIEGFDIISAASNLLDLRQTWIANQDEAIQNDFLTGYEIGKSKAEKAQAAGQLDFFCKMASVVLSGFEMGTTLR